MVHAAWGVPWPIGVLLAVPLIYGEMRARRHPEVVAEQGKRLNLAAQDLAAAGHRQ